MAATNGQNTAVGIMSFIVLACGIAFSALTACLINRAVNTNTEIQDAESSLQINQYQMNNAVAYSSAALWSFGFAYMVPGLLGVISAFVKAKGAYITHMVFCIITLLVMGAFFIFAIFGIGAMMTLNPSTDTCHDDANNKCLCEDFSSFDAKSMDYSCADFRAMYAMGICILLVIVAGWIFTLVITILSGILACRQEPQLGMVLQRPAGMTTVVHLAPVAGMQPQIAYMPPTSDQAQLVHNMEY